MMDTKKMQTIHDMILVDKETGEKINPVPVEATIKDKREVAMEQLQILGVNNPTEDIIDEYLDDVEDACNLGQLVLEKHMVTTYKPKSTIDIIEGMVANIHPYYTVGCYAEGLASLYSPSEPMTPKERKKKYRESTRSFLNKGRKW